ncbi:MAG: adenosylcobinamide-phosphate synthase CbiB [Clostridiales bacterium]|uniref:adenosylcobinamide-phosphate synthase CbiB n=1 Tax=Terrisporobacter sp. TaxID=1965305 RepID=UPI002A56C708|nr:adenosylcobinamide-phosphate synthase CbiB [Terrisporobacter sp.]MCI6459625.1 adenosylcobinamide-phosphate synthase CbiB [Clostridium sp.]MDD7752992.1 adenosylcobinamide-phosphate synthase CbiB [Clostridiales bacterium]MCI7205720.1 adenosylcobinamide-phosphate synthase CbiB [Clostridium sp.]MDY4134190.1 adenosylcobinamide-phosphate synthase CbiB [Terrisporobacter sp.]MDY4735105.1 adenosylcobinamide-phosphate synthase CbiB [Terrisporobacter sp.]
MNLLSIYTGYALDLIIGDPYSFPHPVRYIGKLISIVEKQIRKITSSDKGLKIAGFFLWFIVVGATFGITTLVLQLFKFNKLAYFIVNTILIYTTLATKCLKDESVKIYKVLKTGDLEKSRIQLSYIVGRDTTNLNEKEIVRATVETVAENTVDGIIAPLFYGFIGGAPLAMAYKAVNTLDSTVGYKNDKYYYLGFASAKIDDIANYIPARLGVILLPLGSLFTGFNFKDALKIGIRDRKNHKSPNCAFSEGAVAGALGIQLGGTNVYFGKEVYKPTIGDKTREIEIEDIVRTNKIMYSSSIISIIIFTVAYYLVIAL